MPIFLNDPEEHYAAIDKQVGDAAIAAAPFIPELIQLKHACLKTLPRQLAAHGVEVLVDLASGLPLASHLHQHCPPGMQVVYSDIDEETVAWGQEMLADVAHAHYVPGDIHEPERVLHHPEVAPLLQHKRYAIIIWGITLYLTDEQTRTIARKLYDLTPADTILVANVPLAGVNTDHPAMQRFLARYQELGEPLFARPREGIEALFAPWHATQPFISMAEWNNITIAPEQVAVVGEGGGSAGGLLFKAAPGG